MLAEDGSGSDYPSYYRKILRNITQLQEKKPTAYQNMIKFINKTIFPNQSEAGSGAADEEDEGTQELLEGSDNEEE
jgi:hypothetical protein